MHINAAEELTRELGDLDSKIKRLESSNVRAFELIENDTVMSFHFFNECFKQFWNEFDRHSASQLLLYQKFTKTHSLLSKRYFELFQEQMSYFEQLIDLDFHCFQDSPPTTLNEENSKEVMGYYIENLKDKLDEEGKPLYHIEQDKHNSHYEMVNGEDVPIDVYFFKSDKINKEYFDGIAGIFRSLNSIFSLMSVVCNYPNALISGFAPKQEDIIEALERELRQYAKDVGGKVERDLKKIAQGLKPFRNAPLTPDVWGRVMECEDEMYHQAVTTQVGEIEERYLENISATAYQLIDNYSLLEKIRTTCIDEELFDIRLSVETHNLLSSLNAENLDLFYELVLRRNIIQREMFPEKLRVEYDRWLNYTEDNHNEKTTLTPARQSFLNDVITHFQSGDWKQPATFENVKKFLNTVFGKDSSLLDDSDKSLCEKMWAMIEGGRGERLTVITANLAGFFSEENILIGTPTEISKAIFGNKSQVNNVNKGHTKNASSSFSEILPFLKKYVDKVIRQS